MGLDLGLDREIRPHCQRDALTPGGILVPAKFHNATRQGVGRRFEVRHAQVMGTSIHAVDHGIGCARQLVVQATRDKASDDWLHPGIPIECKVRDTAFDPLLGEPAMNALDNVRALAERPHGGFGIFRESPSCRTDGVGQPKTLKLLHATDHGGPDFPGGRTIASGAQVNRSIVLGGLAGKRAIELGPTVGTDPRVQIPVYLVVVSDPKFERRKMGRAGAHSAADIFAGKDEVATIVPLAAHDDMDVGIVGIPMIDPDPIEFGSEVPLGLYHQVSGKCLEIGKLRSVLRRHNESKMVPIVFAAARERAMVRIVAFGVEHSTGRTIARGSVPSEIGQMSSKGRPLRGMPHDPRLDDHAARPVCRKPICRDARCPATAKGRSSAASAGSMVQSTGLLGGRQHLCDEWLGASGAATSPVPNAPEADAKVIVARHDVAARCRLFQLAKDLSQVAGCRGSLHLVRST
jgi:hypothetical protein